MMANTVNRRCRSSECWVHFIDNDALGDENDVAIGMIRRLCLPGSNWTMHVLLVTQLGCVMHRAVAATLFAPLKHMHTPCILTMAYTILAASLTLPAPV